MLRHDLTSPRLIVRLREPLRPAFLGVVVAAGCGDAIETPRVDLPVRVDPTPLLPSMSDLGYVVETDLVHLDFEDLEFSMAGDFHVRFTPPRFPSLISTAWAHPGHLQDGEITGALSGHFALDWPSDARLGMATLLAGQYASANLTFAYDSGPQLGATGWLHGRATRDGATYPFEIVYSAPQGRDLVGIPCEGDVTPEREADLVMQFLPTDPYEQDSLYDGLDFAALAPDDGGTLRLDDRAEGLALEAFYRVQRTLLSHDHYRIAFE